MNNPRKRKLVFSLFFTFLFIFVIGSTVGAECTFLIAGRNATEDGSILISRTEDFDPNVAKHVIVNEAEEHEEGATIESVNGLEWELPEESYKYVSVKDYDLTYGRFHSTAINSEFVGISATTTTSQNEKAAEADPLIEDGLGENIVTTLVAQRANSAREGIELVGQIIEEKGASESFGLAIADREEVWYLENGGGHRWVAVRIPDDSYFVGANAMRIGEVDLDSDRYMGSDDLIDFAIENDLYDPETDGEFHFAKAYGTAEDYSKSNYRRVWGGMDFFTPSADFDPEAQNYPLFAQPDEDISIEEAKEWSRYHYQGTEYDPYGEDADERGIGTSSTIHSHVMQMKPWLPVEIGGIQWLAISTPLASPYVPYYHGIQEVPEAYQIGGYEYDDDSAFWAFRSVANIALNDYEDTGKEVRNKWEDFEETQYNTSEAMQTMAYNLYENGKVEEAKDLLTAYTNGQALRALHEAFELRDDLRSEMSRGLP